MIRQATADDLGVLHTMMLEMAELEEATDQIHTTRQELHDALFGPDQMAFAHIVEDEESGRAVGYTLWCRVYCTWRGLAVHIDDIYVRPEAEGQGHEKALMRVLARVCADRGYRHMQWWATEGNKAAMEFYGTLKAERPAIRDHEDNHELIILRLSGQPLADLAQDR
ncbi:GNAT family N-acetyltransferase [Streptomyces sp. SL13]|uniref:GNAT family N-acetyltransferase n=1 Tax=Streptantibioticus silvisoli TaxID=2705255 RepID=A0AA90HFK2_9ACTN|nr:GNAT family N-acetyltransferase [Streptantibioticus silvisoli]MDI5974017.1 GNAT family N-acetyltransferase [Streptantibioticus silvisoli]